MELNNLIDHTILKADASRKQVIDLCAEAKQYKFASVCVNPCHAELVSKELKESNVKTCCVIGFPLGASTTETKAFEAEDAIKKGAQEIDMVINIGALKDKDYDYVFKDIRAVVDAADGKALVKVIIETCLLSDEEKIKACEIILEAGADFVKTSTGFSTGGATLEDILLLKRTVGDNILIKASGGIRTRDDAEKLISAGAGRLGTSSGKSFV